LHDAVYSKDWLARSKAGMILQLKNKYFKIMSPEDEAYLVDLLADSVNIVSINACIAVLFSPTQKTIDYLIDLISQKRRSQYEILKTICEKIPLDPEVDLKQIAYHSKCQRFSGADLSSLAREAGLAALRESLSGMNLSTAMGKSAITI
jgi:hypothetical protein